MDQKTIANGGILTGVLLIIIGGLMLPLAVGLVASYPHELWPLGLVLFVCSGMVLYGAIVALKKSSRGLKKMEAEINTIEAQTAQLKDSESSQVLKTSLGKTVISNSDTVLARWVYASDEWKRFYHWEASERKLSNIITGILIAVIATLFLRYGRDASWGAAMGVSGAVAILYGFGSYYFSMASIGKASSTKSVVVITGKSVLINNKLNPFQDEDRWLAEVKILEDADPKVLELKYQWKTRKGISSDEIHVPIPKGRLGEAVLLMDELKRFTEPRS